MGKGKETAKAVENNFPVSRILDEEDLVHLIQDGIDNRGSCRGDAVGASQDLGRGER